MKMVTRQKKCKVVQFKDILGGNTEDNICAFIPSNNKFRTRTGKFADSKRSR